jgi:Domain of unknown function (DUF1906)
MAYAGFDRDVRPPQATLDALKAGSNLSFIVHYLAPSPSHSDTSYVGTYAQDMAAGWGVLHVYVGREIFGPGNPDATAANGILDGQNASALMTAEGAAGRYIFLDVEGGGPLTSGMQQYIQAFCNEAVEGGYGAGVYCSHLLAAEVQNLVPRARLWLVRVSSVNPMPVLGTTFITEDPALLSGVPGAFACQHEEEARLVAFGNLACDLNTCVQQDPSAP